jgi:hypothetical protein
LNSASGDSASVGGGFTNSANGLGAMIPGGHYNVASGTYSFAAGRRAKANQNGTFVWADSTDADFSSNSANQFFVRASGGVAFFTNSGASTGVQVAAGSGTWSSISDRNVKSNVTLVDPLHVLQNVVEMPIATWNYNTQDPSIRHMGPMAQDFYAAFGVGEDDKHITTVDADGVALAAIQGLHQIVQDKDAQIADLQTRVDDLDQRLAALETLASPNQAGLNNPLILALAVVGMVFMGWRSWRKDRAQ